jgi:hypothetical protein
MLDTEALTVGSSDTCLADSIFCLAALGSRLQPWHVTPSPRQAQEMIEAFVISIRTNMVITVIWKQLVFMIWVGG